MKWRQKEVKFYFLLLDIFIRFFTQFKHKVKEGAKHSLIHYKKDHDKKRLPPKVLTLEKTLSISTGIKLYAPISHDVFRFKNTTSGSR